VYHPEHRDFQRLHTQTDPFGKVLTYGYDGDGRVTSVTDSLGGSRPPLAGDAAGPPPYYRWLWSTTRTSTATPSNSGG
jgi:YD repeat-containing protein